MRSRINASILAACALSRFRRDRQGSAAIEFAFVGIPFLMMMFAIVETALMFFATQVLETATADSARLIMTGQAQIERNERVNQFKSRSLRPALSGCSIAQTASTSRSRAIRVSRASTPVIRSAMASTLPLRVQPGKRGPDRRRSHVLSMAGVRIRPWLQPRQHQRRQAAAWRRCRFPQRTRTVLMKLRGLLQQLRKSAPVRIVTDTRGIAAVEFALITPAILGIFLGTAELSQGVAVDRKVTITARSLSDLVAQSTTVSDADMTNIFNAATAIMTPYSASPLKARVSAVNIDASGNATIGWSSQSNWTAYAAGTAVTIPTALRMPNSQLIWGEDFLRLYTAGRQIHQRDAQPDRSVLRTASPVQHRLPPAGSHGLLVSPGTTGRRVCRCGRSSFAGTRFVAYRFVWAPRIQSGGRLRDHTLERPRPSKRGRRGCGPAANGRLSPREFVPGSRSLHCAGAAPVIPAPRRRI